MEALVAGGVAGLYAAGVVGLHRLNVWRMRSQAGGFPSLRWLDWDALLEGLEPAESSSEQPLAGVEPPPPLLRVEGGGPPPRLLAGPLSAAGSSRRDLLCALVEGRGVDEQAFRDGGFSGGQVQWLSTLAQAQRDPDRALERLQTGVLGTVAEVYLRERLQLARGNAVNLELAVFASKRRLAAAVARFGERPSLFFARALASSLLGFNTSAVDNLARAVYFSRQNPFYLRAVMESAYIEEARPALFQQCRAALAALELDRSLL